MNMTNEAAPFVKDYLDKKMLASLGYKQDPSELYDFDIEAFGVISNELGRLESEEIKRSRR